MKCPNCSFANPAGAEECKICGYELTPQPDDHKIESQLDAIFGADDSKRKKIDKRFEAYLEMDDTPVEKHKTDDADLWLEALQRDIHSADEEIENLRRRKTKVSTPSPIDTQKPEPQTDSGVPPKNEFTFTESELKDDPTPVNTISPKESAISLEENTISQEENSTTHTEDENDSSYDRLFDPSEVDEPSLLEEEIDKVDDEEEPSVQEDVKPLQQENVSPSKLAITYDMPDLLVEDEVVTPLVSEQFEEEDSPLEPPSEPDYDDEDVFEINLTEHDPDDFDDHPFSNRQRIQILVLLAILAIILFIFFRSSLKDSDEPVIPPSDDASQEVTIDVKEAELDGLYAFIDNFYSQLSDYVNTGSIGVLSLFEDSQSALSQLSDYKSVGSIVSYDYDSFDDVDLNADPIDLVFSATIVRLINDQETSVKSDWHFTIQFENDRFLITNLSLDPTTSGTGSGTDTNTSTNTNTQNNSTDNTNTASNQSNSETIKPEGFVESGSFSGGIITDGQDVGSIRYGRHEAFERLVFDMYTWNGQTPSETVEQTCHYEATISDDGLTITLLFSGARGASASIPNLNGSDNIASIGIYYPSDDSSVGITIKLKKAGSFKAFELKSPGKVVLDTMAR